jgi:hypothetical protein
MAPKCSHIHDRHATGDCHGEAATNGENNLTRKQRQKQVMLSKGHAPIQRGRSENVG